MNEHDGPRPDGWLDRFWRAFYARRPVDATFIGVHEHDRRLPELGPDGASEILHEMRGLLASAPEPGPEPSLAALDQALAEQFLRVQIAEHESRHLLRNPSFHVGEAVFGLMSPFLPNREPTPERVDALRSRLSALPAYFEQAREQVGGASGPWTERALRECRGTRAFLTDGIDRLLGGPAATMDAERAPALQALEGFADFVRAGSEADAPVACGAELFDVYVRDGHGLDRSGDEVARYARAELERVRARLHESAVQLGATDHREVLARLTELHPAASGYLGAYTTTWQAMRAAAEEHGLVSWPDFPIRYAPRPEWARAAAPDLYFLFYRSPAAFARPDVHEYMVAPLEEGSPADVHAFLRAHNDAVIKLNHVVHHGGLGHHVQNWHAFRSPLSVGRVAAVDGASRIAMFCGGTMAEGWACYATDLMAEVGALTPMEALSNLHARTRMCARAVVDVELHTGRMGLDEAVVFYVSNADMTEAAATNEAVKNSMFPGAALMYLVGADRIHALRRELSATLGGRLSLREFHDAFLSYGSIPVEVIAGEMGRRAAAGLPLGAHDPMEAIEWSH